MSKTKVKFGRRINIYISIDTIGMLDTLTGNRSRFLEDFIIDSYRKKTKRIEKNLKKKGLLRTNS